MVVVILGLSVAGPQRGEWGRLGPWKPIAISTRRPAQPSPHLFCPRLRLQTDWLYSGTLGGRPGSPARDTLTRGLGHSSCHNHDTRRLCGAGRLEEGAWHSLTPGFGFKKREGLGVEVRVGWRTLGLPGDPSESLCWGWGWELFLSDLRLKTHRTCYIRADIGRERVGRRQHG